MMFHAQKENSIKPANQQLLDTEILLMWVITIIIVFMMGFISILAPELYIEVSEVSCVLSWSFLVFPGKAGKIILIL